MRFKQARIFATACALAALGALAGSVALADTPVTSEHIQEMESEQIVLHSEAEELGGSQSPATSLNSAETRANEIQQNIDRLGHVLEQIGANREELARLRQEYSETDIVELTDVPEEGVEKAGEECIRRACLKYGGARVAPYVGWLFLAGDVVSYGGEYVIREINEARLRELVRNESAKHSEIFQLLMDQYCALSQQRAKVRRLREIRERDNFLFREIAAERQRLTERQQQAERSQRATRHATQRRDTDHPGDVEEWRKLQQQPPTRRLEVRPAGQSSQAMSLSPFARDVLAAHNKERAAYGAQPLRWNVALEANATTYANELARTGRRVHSTRAGRGIERENINQGMLHWNNGQMLANWLQEKGKFTPGIFPTVCSGDWSQCGHYSQMIWPTTTDIGCGMASGSGYQWLVCRYSPGGNKDGQQVGTAAAAEQSRLASANRRC